MHAYSRAYVWKRTIRIWLVNNKSSGLKRGCKAIWKQNGSWSQNIIKQVLFWLWLQLSYEGRRQIVHFNWKVQFMLSQRYETEHNMLSADILGKTNKIFSNFIKKLKISFFSNFIKKLCNIWIRPLILDI